MTVNGCKVTDNQAYNIVCRSYLLFKPIEQPSFSSVGDGCFIISTNNLGQLGFDSED